MTPRQLGAVTGIRAITASGGGMAARSTPWVRVLVGALASVSWAFAAMAATAALGLHLLGADAAGSLGPMAAAVVAMAVGGKVRPTGDVGAFGLTGSQTQAAVG